LIFSKYFDTFGSQKKYELKKISCDFVFKLARAIHTYIRRSYMKSIIRIVCTILISGLFICPGLWALDKEKTYVDAYTSASRTKTTLNGAALDAVAEALQAGSADLASATEAKAPGYNPRPGAIGNVMSTNPDGSVGISTISQWVYSRASGGDMVKLQLTEGQNALNLAEADRRGTLFVSDLAVGGKEGRYFVHFKVVGVDILKYSDEAYAAGKFNAHYSGQTDKKSQFTLTCRVLAIEEVTTSVKLGTKMP
jgi:hypothetical protein